MDGSEYRRRARTTIVTVGWNHADLTEDLVASLEATTPAEAYQLVYIDNGSRDKPRLPEGTLSVHLPFNHGFVRGTNIGLALALLGGSEFILLLNNDVTFPETDKAWLARLVHILEGNLSLGALGLVSDKVYGQQRRERAGDGLTYAKALIGFALMLRRAAVLQVGMFDERFEPGNYEDFDYSCRLRKNGWLLAVAESVWVHHKMHQTMPDLSEPFGHLLERNKAKLIQKWGAETALEMGLQ